MSSKPKFRGIAVIFTVKDLDRTKRFYADVLGLALDGQEGYLSVKLPDGTELGFIQGEATRGTSPQIVFGLRRRRHRHRRRGPRPAGSPGPHPGHRGSGRLVLRVPRSRRPPAGLLSRRQVASARALTQDTESNLLGVWQPAGSWRYSRRGRVGAPALSSSFGSIDMPSTRWRSGLRAPGSS